MEHYYRLALDRFEKVKREAHSSFMGKLPGKSDLLLGRLRTRKSVVREVDRRVITKRRYWVCPVCVERNLEAEMSCKVCLVAFAPEHEMANGHVYKTQFRFFDEEQVISESLTTPRVNIGLGRLRTSKMGYSLPEYDEFDTALYDHAIESARFECVGMPVVRFKGRAVDLFGDNLTWAPLRPATLVW
jgi:hypothetical protein